MQALQSNSLQSILFGKSFNLKVSYNRCPHDKHLDTL